MVEMELTAVRVDLQSNTPVVLLQEAGGGRRTLPIFIGAPEATAIAYAMQNVVVQRPLTHDLLRDVLLELGARVDAVVITELRESTFYAELRLTLQGQVHTVSSRPSDGIALAARLGAPIYVEDALLDAEGVFLPAESEDAEDEETPPADADELVSEFRQFIDRIKPEDF
jgi:bifunctional DNase/RNase